MGEGKDLLGQLALAQGHVNAPSLDWCLHLQRKLIAAGMPMRIGEIFVARGLLDRKTLVNLLDVQRERRVGANELGSTAILTPELGSDSLTTMDPNIAAAQVNEIARRGRSPESARLRSNTDSLKRLGNFILERPLSRGGMGSVFVARKEGDSQWYALKILDPLGESSDEMVVRFRREAQFLLSLDHPNIVRAFEVGAAEGRHYISMEYVQGETLESLVKNGGPVDALKALSIMRQTALALAYGEKLNVVHRDIKPANVLIRQDGVVKLADLGLAILANREDLRLTAPGSLVGTPKFMSPEAVDALRDIDIRSDFYSLGCTFYYAICGEPPFTGQIIDICRQQKYSDPRLPSSLVQGLRPCVERLLLTCMQKDRNVRYQSSAELIAAIEFVIDVYAGKRNESEMPVPSTGGGPADDLFGFSKQLGSN